MKLPQMVSNVNKTKKYVVEFGGINKNSRFREGELKDSINLSSDLLPFISQRGKREQMGEFTKPTAVHAHNGIAVVDGISFLYKANGEEGFSEKIQVAAGKKQIAQLNNMILIYPDKVYCDVEDINSIVTKPLEASITLDGQRSHYSSSSSYYYFTYLYHNRIVAKDITPEDGIGSSTNPVESYKAKELYEKFAKGDVVTIPRMVAYCLQGNNTGYWLGAENVIIKSITRTGNETTVYFDDDTLYSREVEGNLREPLITSSYETTIFKNAEQLDFLFENGGRVWGTSGQTICASAYNDIKSFSKFEGLSSDSYSINVSTPGEFTGCAAFSSHLVFFKENYIHRIYGSRPSNFSLATSGAPGVQKGSWGSIKMLNERLFYKGVDGVYMYSGGMPVLISECLGTESYTDAVAGVQGNKYYISMKNSKDEYEMFSYDTLKGVFLKEDNTQFVDTAEYNGKMLYIDGSGKLMAVTGNQDVDDIEWSAELREFNETVNEKKGFSRITLRIELEKGAYMNAAVAMDDGKFELVKTVNRAGKNIVSINIPPNRCDSFRLRLSGRGGCKVMNMVREFVTGNEVR